MSGWEIFGLLVTGGVIGVICKGFFDIVITKIRESGKARRARTEREHTVANRNLENKQRAYSDIIEEFNNASLLRYNRVGNHVITPDEARRRIKVMTTFDMYAPNSLKGSAAKVASFLKLELPNDEKEYQTFKKNLTEAVQNFIADAKEDLSNPQ